MFKEPILCQFSPRTFIPYNYVGGGGGEIKNLVFRLLKLNTFYSSLVTFLEALASLEVGMSLSRSVGQSVSQSVSPSVTDIFDKLEVWEAMLDQAKN